MFYIFTSFYLLIILCVWVFCMHVVPVEAWRVWRIPWNWSLGAIMWVLRIKPRSSGRALSLWAISSNIFLFLHLPRRIVWGLELWEEVPVFEAECGRLWSATQLLSHQPWPGHRCHHQVTSAFWEPTQEVRFLWGWLCLFPPAIVILGSLSTCSGGQAASPMR